jgi:hypothetical protein
MVIVLIILGIILFFGIVRVISSPREGFWGNFFAVWWLDLLIDLIGSLIENADDFTD